MDIKEMLGALLRAGYTEEAIARSPKYAVACKVQALALSESKFKSSRLSNTIL